MLKLEITSFWQETSKAILVSFNDSTIKIWLPKSQIELDDFHKDETQCVYIPQWLVRAKGL